LEVLWIKECAPTLFFFCFFRCFDLRPTFGSLEEFGGGQLIYIFICSLILTNIKSKLHINFEFFLKSFPLPLIWKHKIQSSPNESN
jgi:hypothetical protein